MSSTREPLAARRVPQTPPPKALDPAKERLVLGLLGMVRDFETAGCKTITAVSEVGSQVQGILATKGLPGLLESLTAVATKCPGLQITLTVTENPDVAVVERVLEKPDTVEQGALQFATAPAASVTWHKYGWLDFAVASGKVVGLRADSRAMSPAASEKR